MRLRAARWHLGTQGWNYPAWVGPFYPRTARAADYLTLYARLCDTVEVDSTFYAVPAAAAIESWTRRTPPGFRFALKFPRAATHEDHLEGAASLDVLAAFVGRVRPLGPRLGPVLLQFPPDFGPERRPDLLAFLDALPDDLRWAVEFRDPAWLGDATHEELSRRRIALAVTDSPHLPLEAALEFAARPTTDFTYVRWLGSRELTDYSRIQVDRAESLQRWATALPPLLARGVDIYGYFNNHFAGHSPASLRDFMRRVGLTPHDPTELAPQGELF